MGQEICSWRVSAHLPVTSSLADTINDWGTQLFGLDVFPEFIQATKARLILAAALRVPLENRHSAIDIDSSFPGIRLGDGSISCPEIADCTHIVLNPPFNLVATPQGITWSRGMVSYAAVFLYRALQNCAESVNIAAILPDVLRSGSRYGKWRCELEQLADVHNISLWGLFDPWADIDVFLLRAKASNVNRQTRAVKWYMSEESTTNKTLQSKAIVSVGPLVPHRHVSKGPLHPYLCASGLPRWDTVNVANVRKIRFPGTVYKPPFVLVRRTSRPGDLHRAVGTLVLGDVPVVVENHLLVLRPIDGSLETCQELLNVLQHDKTNQWLDLRIRCRHLTVSALNSLPWWDE